MKVIIGSESFAPNISGVATATELLAKELASVGHKVWVFVPSRSQKSHIDHKYKDFTVVRFRSIRNPFRKGFRVTLLPGNEIQKRIEEIKPNIVHLQDPTSICSQLLKAARERDIPVVVTNHFSLDYVVSYLKPLKPFHQQIKYILKLYLSGFYNQCDYVICPTETVKRYLCDWGIKSPIMAISNGVDLDRFFSPSDLKSVRHQYHLPTNPTVLYMGRVDKDKSIDVFIKAIPHVLKHVNAHFIVAGMGDEVEHMQKMAKKLGIEREVSWIGWLDKNSDEFTAIYQMATVFAIPSSIETQSIVTMEAMASGLPVVGASAGALPELIKEGKSGFLFRPGDSIELASKIVRILKSKQLQKEMNKASLELISEHQIKNCFKKTLNLYEKLLKN
jgi:glycosyltransferase involved in cell wall biosynthesis